MLADARFALPMLADARLALHVKYGYRVSW
jgi:hypothetical protein